MLKRLTLVLLLLSAPSFASFSDTSFDDTDSFSSTSFDFGSPPSPPAGQANTRQKTATVRGVGIN